VAEGPGSSVNRLIGLRAGRQEFDSRQGQELFFATASDAYPASYLTGTASFFLGGKAAGA
jgi:hypothetical protein